MRLKEEVKVRIAPEMREQLEAEAQRQDRPLSYIIREALTLYLDADDLRRGWSRK